MGTHPAFGVRQTWPGILARVLMSHETLGKTCKLLELLLENGHMVGTVKMRDDVHWDLL